MPQITYKLNPPLPVEVQKEDIVKLIHDLHVISDQISQVLRSLPDATGNIRIKQRLFIALKCAENDIVYFNSEYLP